MSDKLNDIYNAVCRLTGNKPVTDADKKEAIIKGLEKIEKKLNQVKREEKKNSKRIHDILNVVVSLANLRYDDKANVSGKRDDFDALALGINMLGEELQASTVSLNEKEILLKEIHHRVKNNLQVISSLLNLQSEKIMQPGLFEIFMESKNRIRAMALVHEKLYQSQNLSRIDFTDYISSFLTYMNECYNLNPEKITIHLDADKRPHYFKIDTAIPCGLILNELVSNSCKYAFPEDRIGNIYLYFGVEKYSENVDQFILQVSDDGIGIPAEIDIKKTDSLGLQLLEMLGCQIGGNLVLDRTNGTKFTLSFPVEKY